MREAVDVVTRNPIISISVIAFFFAQILKVLIVLIIYRKLDFSRLVGSGGMPSSHSATVCAMAASVGKVYGTDTGIFAVAAVTALVVMFDASNVRRAAGEQAKILNYIMENWGYKKPEFVVRELKELLGHTPFEVFVGSALGIFLGVIL
jgi:hypothetical protein